MPLRVGQVDGPILVVGVLTNPRSILIRPADTTAYAQNDLIGTNTTAALVTPPFFQAARVPSASFVFRKYRLYTNLTTGATALQVFIEFWRKPPTFTNGDNGAYAVATGASDWLGSSTSTVFVQVADGAYAQGTPTTGTEFGIVIDGGQNVYWTMKEADATGFTPISQQTFTLVPEIYQN